jgi:hypothetical protein
MAKPPALTWRTSTAARFNNCPTPTFWGAATYGIARPDVAAAYITKVGNAWQTKRD